MPFSLAPFLNIALVYSMMLLPSAMACSGNGGKKEVLCTTTLLTTKKTGKFCRDPDEEYQAILRPDQVTLGRLMPFEWIYKKDLTSGVGPLRVDVEAEAFSQHNFFFRNEQAKGVTSKEYNQERLWSEPQSPARHRRFLYWVDSEGKNIILRVKKKNGCKFLQSKASTPKVNNGSRNLTRTGKTIPVYSDKDCRNKLGDLLVQASLRSGEHFVKLEKNAEFFPKTTPSCQRLRRVLGSGALQADCEDSEGTDVEGTTIILPLVWAAVFLLVLVGGLVLFLRSRRLKACDGPAHCDQTVLELAQAADYSPALLTRFATGACLNADTLPQHLVVPAKTTTCSPTPEATSEATSEAISEAISEVFTGGLQPNVTCANGNGRMFEG